MKKNNIILICLFSFFIALSIEFNGQLSLPYLQSLKDIKTMPPGAVDLMSNPILRIDADSVGASLAVDSLPDKNDMTGKWMMPFDSYDVKQYEKTEWGVKLPQKVESAIDNWIFNQARGNGNRKPAVNPFDPEQLDLWAIIKENGREHRVNGFFYLDFERSTKSPDKNLWNWNQRKTEYRFRIRFAPEFNGEHVVKIFVHVPGMGDWSIEPFAFTVSSGNPDASFVSISPNKHYFQTVNGKIIMPVGINHNDLSFGCECNLSNSDNCEDCYYDGADDICCGVGNSFRHRRGNGDSDNQLGSEIKEHGLSLASYIKREKQLELLKENGATGVRVWTDPFVNDIEFEKLTNYYDRQYQAWEFDKTFEKCHHLGLRIEWCQMMHYMITQNSDGATRWDWGNTDNCGKIDPNDPGCCYFQSFGKESPLDFFTDPNAKKAYKKKLRYMMARWGYSSELFLIDLVSEINNIGAGETWDCVDEDEDGSFENWAPHYNNKLQKQVDYAEQAIHKPMPSYYSSQAEVTRKAIAEWQIEMARYIKEDLQQNHLVSADYTGTAPMSGPDNNPCDDVNFDSAWNSPYIDVIAYSYYDASEFRYEKIAVKSYRNLQCADFTPTNQRRAVAGYQPKIAYEQIDKPVVFAECGGSGNMNCDHTFYYKDMIAGVLSGHATSGMTWSQLDKSTHWSVMKNVYKFLSLYYINAHDPAKENWVPGHEFSSRGGAFDKKRKNGKNDQRTEVVFLERQTPESPKYIGVIMNRTWNMASSADKCGFPESIRYPDALLKPVPVNWDNEKLRIEEAYKGVYTIKYFHPETLELLGEVENVCRDGSLDLVDYPTLGITLEGDLPFCFFIAYKKSETWDN